MTTRTPLSANDRAFIRQERDRKVRAEIAERGGVKQVAANEIALEKLSNDVSDATRAKLRAARLRNLEEGRDFAARQSVRSTDGQGQGVL